MKPVKFRTWITDHCKRVNYQREQYKFGKQRTVQIWNKRTEQTWNKENNTNLEQGEQYKFRTWRTVQIWNKRTEQIWNKENSTNLKQMEQIWNIKPVKFGKWNTDHCKHVNQLDQATRDKSWDMIFSATL